MTSLWCVAALVVAAGICALCPTADARITYRNTCRPNPCQNGGRCRSFEPYLHRCYGCPSGFRGRDCEPEDNDASPWSQWTACRRGREFRNRTCIKPVYSFRSGNFRCIPSLFSSRRCQEIVVRAPEQPQEPIPEVTVQTKEPSEPEVVTESPPEPATTETVEATVPLVCVAARRQGCVPNPCQRNGRCRDFGFFGHVCRGCPRGFRGRDCEDPEICDVGPWGAWSSCSSNCRARVRTRECLKPIYFFRGGTYTCRAPTRQTERCTCNQLKRLAVSMPGQETACSVVRQLRCCF